MSADMRERMDQKEMLYQAVIGVITESQDGEEWEVADEQPVGMFEFHHRLDTFRLDPSVSKVARLNSVARLLKLVITPGQHQWQHWQTLINVGGKLLTFNYPTHRAVDPSDRVKVQDLLRWMIADRMTEQARPRVQNPLTGQWQ